MTKKQMLFKTKGMNRDLSVSAFNPEFTFENVNLRLSTNEGNTLMSWVNERGTKDTGITFEGIPVGTAVINHKLIVFTANEGHDKIYMVTKNTDGYSKEVLFSGNLNLSTDHPLETLVSYETDSIEKVYWTDNLNQPRLINVSKLKDNHIKRKDQEIETRFDFVSASDLNSSITVNKRLSGGVFPPGVIQYCYTYFNKYAQQSNIINVSPLYYVTHSTRGASPEDSVSNSFEVIIDNPDENYDMVRIYSIHRSSIDSAPRVLALEDLPIVKGNSTIRYVDTGSTGSSTDPTELLFLGGTEITALTMEEKDQTLFLGNVRQLHSDTSSIQDYFDEKREGKDKVSITFHNGETKIVGSTNVSFNDKEYELNPADGMLYDNTFRLNNSRRDITTFKGGDYYRFGFQLQKCTGEWSEPVFIDDAQNTKYPRTSLFNRKVNLSYAEANISLAPFAQEGDNNIPDFLKTYKRIRPLIVFPDIQDRSVLCQGVLNPTVFNADDRKEGMPFAQSSWFFRPYTTTDNAEDTIEHRPNDGSDENKLPTNGSEDYREGTKYYVLVGLATEDSGRKLFRDADKTSEAMYPYFDYVIDLGKGPIDIEGSKTMYVAALYRYHDVPPGKNPLYGHFKYYATSYNNPNSSFFSKSYPLSSDFEAYTFSGTLKLKENSSKEKDVFIFSLDSSFGDDEEKPDTGDPAINKEITDAITGYFKITIHKDSTGSSLEFGHYNPLYTDVDHKFPGIHKKQTEIQASAMKYLNVWQGTPNQGYENTNNQFFVDQSIVTLNSADIELDPYIQGYPTSDARLRIVGAVPITSSASSHKITTSSNMLPIGFQTEADEIEEATDFGLGELDINTEYLNKSVLAGRRIVADYLWEDAWVYIKGQKPYDSWPNVAHFLVYPWHSSRSLNSDTRGNSTASSVLKTKVMANLMYSYNTGYFDTSAVLLDSQRITKYDFKKVDAQYHLMENDFVENLRLPKQDEGHRWDINYYPNIDKALVNDKQWAAYAQGYKGRDNLMGSVLMRYKSNSHAVIALPKGAAASHPTWPQAVRLLPYLKNYPENGSNVGQYLYKDYPAWKQRADGWVEPATPFWGGEAGPFYQQGLNINSIVSSNSKTYAYDILWLGELYKEVDEGNLFGGKGRQAIAANKWVVGGEAQLLTESNLSNITLKWTEGDTYYQRYDCLKTYPFSTQDPNQIVEILSFMCETHVNLDGRYDRNRGQRDNVNVMPQNFNLMNSAYDQKDNFFTYRRTEERPDTFPNLITFSKTKTAGADIDLWTNITLASNLEMDGSKGEVNSLQRIDNQLFAFQDSGIAQILYNESVQVQSTQGVPIEIANSGKVQGKRYYSDSIGCSNKHSIVATTGGIYFMDSNSKEIYLFNGSLKSLSSVSGFNTWCKSNIPSGEKKWNPVGFESFVTYYDRQNQDVLFINKDTCLAFSEKLAAFTSFYSYEKTPYFVNLDDTGLWIRDGKLWEHRTGEYCKFFNTSKPYSMTLVGNPEPLVDKTFTNLEFRATVAGDGEPGTNPQDKFSFYLPFEGLEAWNDYQHGYTSLSNVSKDNIALHGYDSTALKRKYRIWRCDIPRNNCLLDKERQSDMAYNYSTDASLKVSRYVRKPTDRIRNPWVYLKLEKSEGTDKKIEIHDVVMTYFD